MEQVHKEQLQGSKEVMRFKVDQSKLDAAKITSFDTLELKFSIQNEYRHQKINNEDMVYENTDYIKVNL